MVSKSKEPQSKTSPHKFSDIPQYTRSANYRINLGWDYLESWLEDHAKSYPLDLSPEYQRDHVWTEEQEVRYVEFVLRGGKSGREINFNCPGWMSLREDLQTLELVDGKQRLQAVRRFMRSEIPAFGTLFKDYKDRLRGVGGGPDFIVCINDLKTREEVLQWYIDMNAGGTVHKPEEIEKVRKLLEKELKNPTKV